MTHDPSNDPSHDPASTDLRSLVVDALRRVAPDVDLGAEAGPDDDLSLRGELELDSLDFLGFVEQLARTTGVRIEESDYGELRTVASTVAFLGRTRGPRVESRGPAPR